MLKEKSNHFLKYADIKSLPIVSNSTKSSPLITIAIPTYKRPLLLKNALYSALNQEGFDDYEIVVVDNDANRKHESAIKKIISDFQSNKIVYYINENNIGMFGNWNRCIELANGEWITILNDDDLLKKDYLKSVAGIIKKNSIIDCLMINAEIKDQRRNSKHIPEKQKKGKNKIFKLRIFDFYLNNQNFGSLGVLFKVKNSIEIGGFNEKFYPTSDYFFFVKYLVSNNLIYKYTKYLAVYNINVNESHNEKVWRKWTSDYSLLQKELNPFLGFGRIYNFFFGKVRKDFLYFKSAKLWSNKQLSLKDSSRFLIMRIVTLLYRFMMAGVNSMDNFKMNKP